MDNTSEVYRASVIKKLKVYDHIWPEVWFIPAGIHTSCMIFTSKCEPNVRGFLWKQIVSAIYVVYPETSLLLSPLQQWVTIDENLTFSDPDSQ